ncbi:MAG: TonB-dependent receptor [Bacteroidales bacterium]|nr:TonB-dependent receptor [Bacteroidales bacterium]
MYPCSTVQLFLLFLALTPATLCSQTKNTGIVSGKVLDALSQKPVEYANMVLLDTLTGKMVTGVVSDSNGLFLMTGVPFGSYILEYSFIGYEKQRSKPFTISRKQPKVELGSLKLGSSAITMNEVTITGEKEMMISKIDRKVFHVQKDLQALTGTVSDVLQTIPSVSVDIDGNVSLRGSGNITILVNGRPSVMTGMANLEQMPASLVDKIEVITNPFAKYRPDGTGGIINIILKKERKTGFNSIIGANAGSNSRYNTNLQLNYNTGKVNLFGSYGYRQDYRYRISDLTSETIDTTTKQSTWLVQNSNGYARPRSHLAQLGVDWTISKNDATGITGVYNYRQVKRHDTAFNFYRDSELNPVERFTRNHDGKESEYSYGLTAFYEHVFNKEKEHQLRADFEYQRDREYEDDYYTNNFSIPSIPFESDHALADNLDQDITFTVDYCRPLWEDASLELGYEGNIQIIDKDQEVSYFDLESGHWIVNPEEENKFHSNQTVHALYATMESTWEKFSVMGGLRAEETIMNLDFQTLDTTVRKEYFALYPTVHLSYKTGKGEWQLNYSKRVNRPDGDDMNPVPEYRDPRNIRVGNPRLKPEDIHSLEFGYAIKLGKVNLVPTLFYRYTVNGFTRVTTNLNDTVFVTTYENLAKDQSAGLDFSGTLQTGKIINLNFSASGFYNQIDASNIGYSSAKSSFSWNAKLNASINITKTSLLQVNGQYRSEVLTPQGFRRPTWVVNLGFRQDFLNRKLSLIATVSDLFNSQSLKNSISTPLLVQESLRRRDARVIYCGFVFHFGTNGKKSKETKFEFDTGIDRN